MNGRQVLGAALIGAALAIAACGSRKPSAGGSPAAVPEARESSKADVESPTAQVAPAPATTGDAAGATQPATAGTAPEPADAAGGIQPTTVGTAPAPAAVPPAAPAVSAVEEIRRQAVKLDPLIESPWVKEFLAAAETLPEIETRILHHDVGKTQFYAQAEYEGLPEVRKGALRPMVVDTRFYYNTRYGTPLAYARPLDLLGRAGFAPQGRSILDFGYGGIGHLRLLASLGAQVCGIEVDPLFRALYGWPGDQGTIQGRGGKSGKLRLVQGRFPSTARVVVEVGGGYDIVISKNTLKLGYIHPEKPVVERQMIQLGVEDAVFVRKLSEILKPGGRVMIYNLTPAPNAPDKPYRPWADGRCPFQRKMWEDAGFRVLAFDQDDSVGARELAHALGWDSGDSPIDLEKDLFALYTLVEKP